MGSFSFLCTKTGKPALSTGTAGSLVTLHLLEDGKIQEIMCGNYNGYGRVFSPRGGSFRWRRPWKEIADLIHNDNPADGIAMTLGCDIPYPRPTKQSDPDPDQGWGSGEDELRDEQFETYAHPYHQNRPWTKSFYALVQLVTKTIAARLYEPLVRSVDDDERWAQIDPGSILIPVRRENMVTYFQLWIPTPTDWKMGPVVSGPMGTECSGRTAPIAYQYDRNGRDKITTLLAKTRETLVAQERDSDYARSLASMFDKAVERWSSEDCRYA